MAVRVIGNDYNGVAVDANSDIWILSRDSVLAHTGFGLSLLGFDDNTVQIDGTVVAGSDGIYGYGSDSTHVVVSQTGSVTGDSAGIDISGDYNQIIVQGAVSGFGGSGIGISGVDASIANSGWVSGPFGIYTSGDGARIVNTGDVAAKYTGVYTSGHGCEVVNSGRVIAEDTAIYISTSSGQKGSLFNSGTISVDPATSSAKAVLGGAGDETVVNSGRIVGDIYLGAGDDIYDGRGGSVNGTVRGQAGNDTYIVENPNTDLVELGGEGIDTVWALSNFTLGAHFEKLGLFGTANLRGIGNGANNTITGNAGDNTLLGRLGNDTLKGGDGDDGLFGGQGKDTLLGADGDDRLRGHAGNDRLTGGSGDDDLSGGDGADRLNGGAQNDKLHGGAGYDTFIFAGSFGRDVIKDFHASNKEKIDLSGVSAITGYADLSKNHMTQAGSDVEIDAGGGNRITLEDIGLGALSAGDFIF